jgi:hypothetical protein
VGFTNELKGVYACWLKDAPTRKIRHCPEEVNCAIGQSDGNFALARRWSQEVGLKQFLLRFGKSPQKFVQSLHLVALP